MTGFVLLARPIPPNRRIFNASALQYRMYRGASASGQLRERRPPLLDQRILGERRTRIEEGLNRAEQAAVQASARSSVGKCAASGITTTRAWNLNAAGRPCCEVLLPLSTR